MKSQMIVISNIFVNDHTYCPVGWQRTTYTVLLWSCCHQRRVSHFHFYENLVAANLGKHLAL